VEKGSIFLSFTVQLATTGGKSSKTAKLKKNTNAPAGSKDHGVVRGHALRLPTGE